ncbi:MAG: hypothetical protein VR72_06870 [Clostridiaceae bacterium BRH_c20a]|nr:MAG: hypothetical protein VR72_06870 [Clostridiaceae bacterium BRH_c20a]
MPITIFTLWLSYLFITILSYDYRSNLEWIRIGDIWSRYLMAFPGAFLSGYAILLQKNEFKKFGFTRFLWSLQIAAISFIIYSLSAGLIVPSGSVGLSTLINSDMFFQMTGIPIEIIRGISGLVLSISIVIILQVFDKEYILRIQEIEIAKARLEERNNLAQDLHDDIIQSLYATNLEIEDIKLSVDKINDKKSQEVSEKLSFLLKNRSKIIDQIREYIGELKMANRVEVSLRKRLENLINEFDLKNKMYVKCEFDLKDELVSLTTQYHLTLILKEAVSNVIRHAKAQNFLVRISSNDTDLILEISDDGVGFNERPDKNYYKKGLAQGLNNIKKRVEILNGFIEIKTKVNEGTKIIIKIPINGGQYD